MYVYLSAERKEPFGSQLILSVEYMWNPCECECQCKCECPQQLINKSQFCTSRHKIARPRAGAPLSSEIFTQLSVNHVSDQTTSKSPRDRWSGDPTRFLSQDPERRASLKRHNRYKTRRNLAGFLHCALESRWQRFGQFLFLMIFLMIFSTKILIFFMKILIFFVKISDFLYTSEKSQWFLLRFS